MIAARDGHTAMLLNDGTVLLAGGETNGFIIQDAELYDPLASKFTETGGMQSPRLCHTMTLLNSGVVLVTGGVDGSALASAELYQ